MALRSQRNPEQQSSTQNQSTSRVTNPGAHNLKKMGSKVLGRLNQLRRLGSRSPGSHGSMNSSGMPKNQKKEPYQKIDVLYFPKGLDDPTNGFGDSKRSQFFSYTSLMLNDDFLRETKKVMTPRLSRNKSTSGLSTENSRLANVKKGRKIKKSPKKFGLKPVKATFARGLTKALDSSRSRRVSTEGDDEDPNAPKNPSKARDLLEKLNLRLDFNKKKLKTYVKKMTDKTKNRYTELLRSAQDWENATNRGSVKVMKRTDVSNLDAIRDKMIKMNFRKRQISQNRFKSLAKYPMLTGLTSPAITARIPHLATSRTQGGLKPHTSLRLMGGERSLQRSLTQTYQNGPKTASGHTDPTSYLGLDSLALTRRTEQIKTIKVLWEDNSEYNICKNFESTEGIGYCYLKRRLYFFGGIGTSYLTVMNVFHPKTHQFSSIHFSEQMAPSGRCFHSMTSFEDKIVLFGGESSQTGGLNSRFLINETWILHLGAKKWLKVPDDPKNTIEPRKKHRVAFVGRNMVVCGGLGYEDKLVDDFLAFDMDRLVWRYVKADVQGWVGLVGHSFTAVYCSKVKDLYSKTTKKEIGEVRKV